MEVVTAPFLRQRALRIKKERGGLWQKASEAMRHVKRHETGYAVVMYVYISDSPLARKLYHFQEVVMTPIRVCENVGFA